MNHDVFISYSSKEKSIADGVCHYLEANGVKCWMAPRDIPASSDYGDLIDEAINSCSVTVLVYSQCAVISKWVRGEVNVAFDEGKPIIPFRIDETAIKGSFRVMLNQLHWIDAYPSYADRLPDLLRSVCTITGRTVLESLAPKPLNHVAEEVDLMPKPTEAELHIEVDADCHVYRFNKEVMLACKGEDNVLMLQKGKHKLRLVSVENGDVSEERIVEIKDTNYSDFIEISLATRISILDRKAKKEAERKAKQMAIEEEKRNAIKEEKEYVSKGYSIVGICQTEVKKDDTKRYTPSGNSYNKIKIANTVKRICNFSFAYWGITSIIIPKTVTIIGDYTFFHCHSLVSVDMEIPDSVTHIGEGAFKWCESITTIVIPRSVITIGEDAFAGCDKLETVRLLNSNTRFHASSFPKHTKIIKG